MTDDVRPAADPAPSPYRYWAFISYSSKDASWARWLHRAIETYGVPAKLVSHTTPTGEEAPPRLRPVFHDRVELPAASDLGAQIEDALAASRFLIVICSPRAAASQWVNKEIETFRRVGDRDRILAIIVDGEPNSGGDTECFPPILREVEPIAADARVEGDGKTNAKLKLLAGMLGVSFDTLKQRDSARRIRRLQLGIAAALALAAAFAGLAVYANAQRVAAVEARKEAETQRTAAVEARDQAEGLLEYLIGELSDQLEPIGRLDIVKNVQEKVDEYYRETGTGGTDARSLRNRITAAVNKGNRLYSQGDLAGAEEEFRLALSIAKRLSAATPDSAEWHRRVAECHNLIGQVLQNKGDLTGALRENRAAIDALDPVASARPDDAGLGQLLAHMHITGADLLMRQGDIDGALAEVRVAVEIDEGLAAAHPGDTGLQQGYGSHLTQLGEALQEQGDAAGALNAHRRALAVAERLVATDARNAQWQRDLASAHEFVGVALQETSDLRGALSEFRAGLAIFERLCVQDPTNTDWQECLARSHSSLGDALRDTGDHSGALSHFRAHLSIVERLVKTDAHNAAYQRELAGAHQNIASVLEGRGDDAGALAEYRIALEIFQRLAKSDPTNTEWVEQAEETAAKVNELTSGRRP